jgi:hypothetical protein
MSREFLVHFYVPRNPDQQTPLDVAKLQVDLARKLTEAMKSANMHVVARGVKSSAGIGDKNTIVSAVSSDNMNIGNDDSLINIKP